MPPKETERAKKAETPDGRERALANPLERVLAYQGRMSLPFSIMFRLNGETRILCEQDLVGITVLEGGNKITLLPHTFAEAMTLGAKAMVMASLKRKVDEIIADGDGGGEGVWVDEEVFDAPSEAPHPAAS